ncbi:copper chaperone PCu(A)C [Roseovarius sp. SYSU LYC5161]|jgi:copper(I)-binding protein|uniref:copper chaperone PCu(A)C n=1 Tax=Roseovarius halophilus (ex Wu et al. 2025) TaxID=3376060 RepID=UPI00399BA36E
MTPKHLIPFALLAALAWQPALAAGDDHDAETAEAHSDDRDHEADHDDDHAAHEDESGDTDHLSTMGDLRLLHGWTRATTDDTALIFVEIKNTGETPVTLTGGAADLAESAALVGFTLEDGTPVYPELPALPVAPATEMVLAPQGVALRLDGLSRALAEGESFDVTLAFAEAEVAVTVDVEAADASQHGHAGHAH